MHVVPFQYVARHIELAPRDMKRKGTEDLRKPERDPGRRGDLFALGPGEDRGGK